jgi:hypothetical protein
MQFLKLWALGMCVGVAVFLFDRVGLWMEGQGWIYWRRRSGMSTRLGGAFLELHSMLEPSKRHVIEIRKKQKRDQAESGDPEISGANHGTLSCED